MFNFKDVITKIRLRYFVLALLVRTLKCIQLIEYSLETRSSILSRCFSRSNVLKPWSAASA